MRINVLNDLKAGTYESDDARIKIDAGAGSDSELTLDFQLAVPPVVIDPPPVIVDPPAPPVPPSPPTPPPAAADAPVAKFTATVADNGYDVELVDESVNVAKEQWAYGGGTSTVIGSRATTFKKAGTYPIKLIVWNAAGKSSSLTVSVTTTVDAPVAAPPPAQPPASTRSAFSISVHGAVMSINEFSTGAVAWHWDFGDGTTAEGRVSSHTYTVSGLYTTKLTTTAADGTSNYSTARAGVIVPLPAIVPPVVSVAGQAVTVRAVTAFGDTTLSLQPGERKPLVAGNEKGGSAVYYADGKGVCIENAYAGVSGNLSGHFTVTAGTTQLFDGDLTLWYRGRTRPFWLEKVQPLANPDLSFMPKLGAGSGTASLYDWYQSGDNGPTGVGNIILAIGTGGEWAHLGPVPQWDADYLTNPSAQNLEVVRGMSDACAPMPTNVIDFATQKMLSVKDWPKASTESAQAGTLAGNPVAKITDVCPIGMGQAQAHATNYCALACAVFGTDYDREQLALWCNYINCLNQNYLYRSALGCCVFRHNAGRGFGRGLTVLVYAAKYAPPEQASIFGAWLDEAAADGKAAWLSQAGIQIMQQGGPLVANVNAYENGGYAPWMQHLLTFAIGNAIHAGNTVFQPILDYFAGPTFDAVLKDHEFATIYTSCATKVDGTPVDDWAEGLQRAAVFAPKLAAALALPEGSLERITAYEGVAAGYQAGDFHGYPTSATGYPAVYQAALAVCVRYATDQVKAQAAWAAFQKWQRIDYRTNPKYNVVP